MLTRFKKIISKSKDKKNSPLPDLHKKLPLAVKKK
jgi:hypothetical protein